VVFNPYAMGRLEALWPNAHEFRPERFLGCPRPSPFVFTAFQASAHQGARDNSCLPENGNGSRYTLPWHHHVSNAVSFRQFRIAAAPSHLLWTYRAAAHALSTHGCS
jgi:hypothetical protein